LIGKGISLTEITKIRQEYMNSKIGILHPDIMSDGKEKIANSNFVVVGSTTEHNNVLPFCSEKKVFIVPQIEFFAGCKYDENFFYKNEKDYKQKVKSRPFTILWHGEGGHLANFPKSLKSAINYLHNEKNIKIIFLSNHHRFIPTLHCEIECREYSEEHMIASINEADLGLVTSIGSSRKTVFNENRAKQRFVGDLITRIKTVSNPARAFLFTQHHLPFVCDENPEHFIFNEVNNPIICSTERSWINNIIASQRHRVTDYQKSLFQNYHNYQTIIRYLQDLKYTL
jgi:hypothetical protein